MIDNKITLIFGSGSFLNTFFRLFLFLFYFCNKNEKFSRVMNILFISLTVPLNFFTLFVTWLQPSKPSTVRTRGLCVIILSIFSCQHCSISFHLKSQAVCRNSFFGSCLLKNKWGYIFGWRSCDENKIIFCGQIKKKMKMRALRERKRVQKYFLHKLLRLILISRNLAHCINWLRRK